MRQAVKIALGKRGALRALSQDSTVLVLRPNSGISGDMLVAGLAGLAGVGDAGLSELCEKIGIKGLGGLVRIEPRSVSGIAGVGLVVELPAEQAHRSLADILAIIAASGLSERAKEFSVRAFGILAEAEGEVHGVSASEVVFHEVGALDSVVDVCLAAALFEMLSPARFVCGPLPVCDGVAQSAHGPLFTPAPAVLRMLEGVAVTGLASTGETVTPTAISLLKAFGVEFGGWPDMVVSGRVVVYGSRLLPGVPNGAVFALGAAVA
jgi:pyridinium-3,5-bisthiocarboxylic acid mononucleotide nickel chelatase